MYIITLTQQNVNGHGYPYTRVEYVSEFYGSARTKYNELADYYKEYADECSGDMRIIHEHKFVMVTPQSQLATIIQLHEYV